MLECSFFKIAVKHAWLHIGGFRGNGADFGKVLINKGNGKFDAQNVGGVQIKGEVRRMLPISIKNSKGKTFVLGRNNETVRVIEVK